MTRAVVVCSLFLWMFVQAARGAGEGVGTTSVTLPVGMVQSDEWQMVHAHVSNPTDAALDAWVVTGFDLAGEIQFAMPVWVPPHAARSVDLPVHTPVLASGPSASYSVETTTLLLTKSATGEERQLAREPGLLARNKRSIQVAVVADTGDETTTDLLRSLLNGSTNRAAISYLTAEHLPEMAEGLAPFKTMFISTTKTHANSAQRQALRRWLMEGGQLVILATRLSQEDALLLLGDDWAIEPVNRVELNDFQIQPTGDRQLLHLDPAGEMVRVLAPGMTAVASVNGWPAQLEERVGMGQLTVITTSPEAFEAEGYRGNNAGQTLAASVMPAQADPETAFMSSKATSEALSDLASQQVSYRIVSREVVMEVLGGFVLAVAAVGVGLALRQRLEWVAGAGVVFAIAAAGVLISLGSAHPLPLTLASAQFARYVPAQRAVVARGQIQVFSPTAINGELRSTTGGKLWPDLRLESGSLVRLVWDDVDRFHWENLHLPAGAAVGASVCSVLPMENSALVDGTFGPDGLRVTCRPGDFGEFADAVLLAPDGNIAPAISSDGAMTFNNQGELPEGTYLNGSLLTEMQRQRQIAYRAVLSQRPKIESPTRAAWSDGQAISGGGITLPNSASAHGTTLVELPVHLHRTAPHTTIHLPTAFVPFTLVRGSDGMAPAYSPATGQWIPNLTSGAALHFRFNLPQEVLPLQVETCTLHVSLRSPGRTVSVSAFGNGPEKVLDSREGPVAPYDVALTGADAQPDSHGFIYITVRVGNVNESLRTWDVHSVSMDVVGTTAPDASAASR